MEEKFRLEIISPEKIIFSDNVAMVTLPSYEGEMSILKNHVSIITFLRPGIITVQKEKENFDKFFVQDGTIEFFKDILVILSSSIINIKDLSKDFLDDLNKDIQEKILAKDITDNDRYILNHKLEAIKDLRA